MTNLLPVSLVGDFRSGLTDPLKFQFDANHHDTHVEVRFTLDIVFSKTVVSLGSYPIDAMNGRIISINGIADKIRHVPMNVLTNVASIEIVGQNDTVIQRFVVVIEKDKYDALTRALYTK